MQVVTPCYSLIIVIIIISIIVSSVFITLSPFVLLFLSICPAVCPVWGRGTPLPLVHLFPHLFPLYFYLSFIGFTYFLLLSIPSFSTRIIPLRFQAGGRRRRPNLGFSFCFVVFYLCYLYSLV